MPVDVDRVLEAVSTAPKYRHVMPDTLARIAVWSAEHSRSTKEAVKRAKRRLHQVYGAFLGRRDVVRAEAALRGLADAQDETALRAVCAEVMSLHASTRERLPLLRDIYEALFEVTGVPRRILDCAAGLHPFAIPWMGLPADADYVATDLDTRLPGLLELLDQAVPQRVAARCLDLAVDRATYEADVAFVLKASTTLERQEPGATARLLRELPARYVVLSFPTTSLGGRTRGMTATYERFMEGVLAETSRDAVRIRRSEEIFFVVAGPTRGDRR